MTNGHIEHVPRNELADIIAGLVRNGLTFNVTRNEGGTWNIELTGGY